MTMTLSPPTPQVLLYITFLILVADGPLQGYKPTAAKSIDEYKKLDAGDESLARWKASLGIKDDGFAGDSSKPQVDPVT